VPGWSPGAALLGQSTPLGGAASTTGVVIFGTGFGMLFVEYYIPGTAAATTPMLRLGTTTTTDTGTNYSSGTANFNMGAATVGTGTSRVSQTGIHIDNVSVANGRRGLMQIHNPATQNKTIDSRVVAHSAASPTAATSVSTVNFVVGTWFNSSAQAACCELIGNGQNLNTGTYISVYGIPGTA